MKEAALIPPFSDDLLSRFFGKVDTSGDCWLWTASVGSTGYGQFRMGRQTFKAHRLSWIFCEGAIPCGLSVLHRCDVPRCVNPGHLFLGDQADNMRDASDKGRVRTTPTKGEAQPNHRLTEEVVRTARALHAEGVAIRELARRYGVHSKTMRQAIKGERWSHV